MNNVHALLRPASRWLPFLLSFLGGAFCHKAEAATSPDRVVTYAAPKGIAASPNYSVSVSGHPVFVYTAPVLNSAPASFASFDFSGNANVTVDVSSPVQSVQILPTSYGITPLVQGSQIHIPLSKPLNLTIEVNGSHDKALHLFANPLEINQPKADDPHVLYFGPGVHEITTLEMHDGMTLYLAGGAVLRGVLPLEEKPTTARDWAGQANYRTFITAKGAKNIKICGRGIIDMTGLPWHARTTFFLAVVANVDIEGITLIGAPSWGVALFQATNVHINNIKEICARENSDGIDICNSQQVTVENCFLRNNDDEVCVKTNIPWPAQISKDIVVQNCVIWNERARGLGITNETRRDIDNVVFRNCDIIHDFSKASDCAALAVIISDSGTVTNIRFEDIRLEEVKTTLTLCTIGQDMWSHESQRGHVNGLIFKNITVSGDSSPQSTLAGYDEEHLIENVTFDHLVIQGRLISNAKEGNFSVNPFVRNLQFTQESPGAISH